MRKKKILIITDNFEFLGGMRVMAERVSRQFPKDDVRLLSSVSRRFFFGRSNIWGVFFPLNIIYLFKLAFLTSHLLFKLNNFSRIIIVSPTPLLGMISILLGRKADLWFATTFPDELANKVSLSGIPMNMKLIIAVEKLLLPFYRLIENVVLKSRRINSYALSTLSACYYNTKREIPIIRYPIESEWVQQTKDDGKKQYDIISVGRFNDPRKNLNMLLNVSMRLPQCRLAVIGPLPSGIDLEDFHNIDFIGEISREEVRDYYRRSKIFFLPSLQEGLGIVYLEAMSAGLPVITLDNGGSRDLIREGYNGHFVSPTDIKGAAEKIKRLLSKEADLNEMSGNSIKFIAEYSLRESELFKKIFN